MLTQIFFRLILDNAYNLWGEDYTIEQAAREMQEEHDAQEAEEGLKRPDVYKRQALHSSNLKSLLLLIAFSGVSHHEFIQAHFSSICDMAITFKRAALIFHALFCVTGIVVELVQMFIICKMPGLPDHVDVYKRQPMIRAQIAI